jgi:serine/threonine-protein kinase
VFATGLQIGKYELGKKLGQGGFGVVFVGQDLELEREVALKFLHPEHTANPEILRRFLQEARSAAKISHPGIVTVFECGQVKGTNTSADGVAFIAMELLHGESLSDRLSRSGRLEPAVAIELVRQVASALDAAHRAGIVHRDLKPDNIFLASDPAMPTGERVKVLDFGIAKLAQKSGSSVQTQSQMVFGTPRYMSPEQCKSAAHIDHRSDIYTLGCIVFELVCGRPPFDGETGELIAKHQLVAPPTARSVVSSLPESLDTAISAMLAKEPGSRPQTMLAVQRALEGHASASASSGVAPTLLPDAAESLQRFTPVAFNPGAKSEPSPAERAAIGASPTTLSGASGGLERDPAPRRSKPGVVIAGGLAVAAIGAVVVWFAVRGGPESTTASPLPQPVAQPQATPPPPKPAGPIDIELKLTSNPKADVYLVADGRLVGETPYTYKRTAAEGQIVFLLKAEGHKDARVVMPADRTDERAITLDPIAAAVIPPAPVTIKKPVKPVKPTGTGSGSATPTRKPGDQVEVYK